MMAMLDGNRTLRASMISHPEPDWQLVHLGRREAAIPQSAIPRIPGNDHQCFRNGRCWTGTCRSRRSSRTSVLSHEVAFRFRQHATNSRHSWAKSCGP